MPVTELAQKIALPLHTVHYRLKQLQKEKLLNPDFKATDLVNWLKKNFDLGHGHSMAIWAGFKSKGWVQESKKKK